MKSRISKLKSRFKLRRPENLRIVVLSIATAAVFWLFNALNKEYDATVSYPVNWDFDQEDFIVVDELPSSIKLNVNGLGWNLLRVSLGLKANPLNVDLPNPSINKKIPGVSLTNRIADNLEELQLNYILDDTLHINIDERKSRSFGVYIDSANISLAENFRVISPIRYSVDLLEIEGPNELLYENPSDSFLIQIPETNINRNYDEEIDFSFKRSELFLFKPGSIEVAFDVAEFVTSEREISVQKINFPERRDFILMDTINTVFFEVQRSLESEVIGESIKVVADYQLFNPSDSTIILKIVEQPENITGARIALPQVRLTPNE